MKFFPNTHNHSSAPTTMKTIQPNTNASRTRKTARILAGSIAALLAVQSAQAASQVWDGGSGANGNWSTLLNWLGDTAVPGATSGTTNIDIATFNAAIANTWGLVGTPIIIDSATQNLGGINFDTAAGSYFIGTTAGNSLLLSSGGTIQILSTLTATNAIETINAPLIIQGGGGTYTFANNSANGSGAGAGTLNFGGGITGGAAGATILTLSGANTNANTISGIIGNGTATSVAITKSGAGTWVLSGANSYTGATAINAGVLNIQHATALGTAAGSTTVASGAALQIQGGITVGAEALSLTGTGVLATGALRNISGANVWQGTVTLAGTTRINSDSGSLTFNTAATSITGGGSNRNLTLGGVGNGTVGGIINTGTGTLTKDGAGTWTLSGANTYTGQTSVGLGVLRLDSVNALGTNGILVGNGVTNLNINGTTNGGVYYGIIGLGSGDFTRALGTGVTQVQFSAAGGWAAFGADRIVNLGGAGASVVWGTATTGFNGKDLYLGTATATNTVDLQNAIDMTNGGRNVVVDNGAAAIDAKMSGIITGVAGGNLTKSGSGTLVLSGANTYLGTTTINAGVLRVTGNSSVANGAVTVNIGAALGGTGTLGGAVTVATGGAIDLRDTAIGTLTVNSTLTFSGTTAAPNNLYFDLPNAAASTEKIVTTGAVTAGGGTSGVLVNFNQLAGAVTPGTGVVLIQAGAASTYANYALATTRSGGNVYSNLTASGNNLVVDIATAAAGPAAAFWVGGANPWSTVANWNTDATSSVALGSIPGVGTNVTFATTTPVAANLTTNTVDVDFEINSLTFNAAAGGVTIGGTNMLTIDANIANGNTLGNGITSSNTSGTNTISTKVGLGGNQTWTTASGGTLAVSGVVSDFGGGYALTKAGAGTLTLSGVNTITGPLTISAGELQVGGAGSLLAGSSYAGNITNNGTFRYNSTVNDYTFSGIISGTGAVIKDNTTRIILNGVNTYSGGTTINAGSIDMNTGNNFALGSGPITVNATGQLTLERVTMFNSLIFNGGTLFSSNGFGDAWNGPVTLSGTPVFNPSGSTLTIAGNISGSGALTKNGSGTLTLSGTNNYTGTTILTAGNINVGTAEIAGTSGPLGTPTTPAGSIVLNGGFLQYSTFNNAAPVVNVFDYSSRFSTAASQQYNVDTNNIGQGVIWGANLTSSGGTLTKSGLGTLYLTGANTYDGVTTIANGALGVSSLNNISSPLTSSSLGRPTTAGTGTIAIGSGGNTGRLFYSGAGETTDRVINLAGTTGGATIEQAGTGLLKFTSALTATGAGAKTLTLQGSTAGTGEISGAIVDNGGANTTALTKAGSGLWTLSGANTYTGATTVGGGTLTFNRQTGSLNSGSTLTFGSLAGTTGGSGTFNMDNVGASGALTQTLGALTFSAGDGTVKTTRTAAFDQAITFASLAARTAGATANFVNTGTNSATNGFVISTSPPAAGTLIDRGYFYNGSSYAAYDAGGFIRAFGAADTNYLAAPTGATIGASVATSNVDLTTGNITAQTTISANTINLRSNSLTMSATGQVLSTNGILSSGSSTATLGIGTKDSILQAATAGAELVVRVNGSSDNLTLNSIVRDNTSAGKLTKTGSGALTLTGTNTFTGGTYLNSGTLNINSIGALSSGSNGGGAAGTVGSLLINDGTTISNTSGGALTFVSGTFGDHTTNVTNQSVNISLNGSVTFDGAANGSKDLYFQRSGDNNTNVVILLSNSTVNVTAGTFNIGSKMTGAFSLTKNGVGELQLGNFNNTLAFTGGLFVNEGTFTGTSPQFAFGNGMVFLGDLTAGNSKNATLAYSSENQGNNNNVLSRDSITVNAGSSGNLAFVTKNTNNNGFAGISGTVILNNNLTLAAKAASTSTQLSGVVRGTGGLRIGDTTTTNLGTVLLSGANTYTGGTIVNTGTLTGTGASPLGATTGTLAVNNPNTGAGTAVVLNLSTTAATTTGSLSGTIAIPSSGTNTATINTGGGQLLTVNQTSAGTYAGVIAGNGSFTLGAASTNTLILSGANTYTGATTITAGTLSVATIGNGSVASGNLGSATNAAANLVFNGGTLRYTGATASTDRNFAINTGKTATFEITSNNLTVSGASTATNGALTKTGGGTLTLSGANTYTGATTVSMGTLALASTASLVNTAMTVASGATLSVLPNGGNVTSAGTLTLSAGSAFTMSGTDNALGTFTLGGAGTGLTLGGATVPALTFDIGNAASGTDRIIVTNNVSAPSGGTITISQLTGLSSLTVGNYNLITSAGGFTGGGANGFTLSASSITVGSTVYDLSLANSTSSNEVLTVTPSSAPVAYWAGALNGIWNSVSGGVSTNWRTSVAGGVDTGVTPSATTNVFFVTTTPVAGNLTTTLGANTTISSLNFTADATTPVSIGGNTLTLNAGAGNGITVAGGSAAHTISSNVALGASQTWAVGNAAANALTVSGAVTGGFALTKAGTGTLTLSGTNTYSGITTVSAGTLQLAKTAALYNSTTASWTAANINVQSGATLDFNVGGTNEFTTGNVSTLLTNLAASASATNGMNAGSVLGFDTTNASGGNFTVADVIADTTGANGGARGLTKLGTNTLTLTGANTYTGATTISAGTLQLGSGSTTGSLSTSTAITNNGNLTINRSDAVVQGTNFSTAAMTGTGSLTQAGAGTTTLSAANYTGVTTVSAGTLQFATTAALYNNTPASWTAANINVASGGTLAFNVGGSGFSTGNVTTLLGNLAASASATNGMNAGAILGFDTTGGNFTVTDIIADTTGVSGGLRGITKLGSGNLTLTGVNTYTGGTMVNSGTFTLGNQSGGGTGSFTLAAGTTFQQENFEGNQVAGALPNAFVLTGAGNVTMNIPFGEKDIWLSQVVSGTGGITVQGFIRALTLTANNTFSGGVIHTNGSTRIQISNNNALGSGTFRSENTFDNGYLSPLTNLTTGTGVPNAFDIASGAYLNVNTSGDGGTVNLLLSGAISSAVGNGGLYKKGAGTLTLSGANTYTGSTTLGAGTLSVATIGNGGVASGNLGSATNAAANLVFNGGTLQYTGATDSTDRNFTINAGMTATFDITANNLTVSGASTATNGALTKTGAGTLTLSGANTYTGLTTVSVGTLVASNATSLGTIAAGTTVTSGATLDVQADITTEAITVGGTGVSGNGALVASTGTGTVGGAVALTAATSIGGAGTLNVNGAVTGGFDLNKVGAGTTNFDPAGSLAGVGNLTAEAGTTNVNSVLGTGTSAVSVGPVTAATLKFGSVSQTLSSLTIGAGSTVSFTSGLASFSGGGSGGKAPKFGGGSAVVPEPGTLGLLLVGALGMLNRRRRDCSRGQ